MTPIQQREVVKFAPNVPVEVALKFALPGKIISTKAGERVLYTLADDRVMFLDLGVARQVEGLGVNVREKFFVCKPSGTKKDAPWKIWRSPCLEEPSHAEVAEKPAASVPEETALERQLRQSIELVKQGKWGEVGDGTFVVPSIVPNEASAVTPAPVQADAQSNGHHAANNNGNGSTNGRKENGRNGNGNGQGSSEGSGNGSRNRPEDSVPPAWAESLLGQANALVDVYASALSSASTKHGNQVKPEDVRSLLVTVFIQRSKVVSYGA